jgi:hypothetical protein
MTNVSLTSQRSWHSTLAGACDRDWLELDEEEHHAALLGVARIGKGCLFAAPIALLVKAVGVAAIILPLGGSLAIWGPGVAADAGGMLGVILLWRRLLLNGVFTGLWPWL